MKLTVKQLTFAGVLAAAYAAITLATAAFAYGPLQFRIAEAFSVLCCFTPASIAGMTVGCVAANLASSVSTWDTVIGSAATLLACLITWRMSGAVEKKNWVCALVPLPTVLCNAVIIGAEIAFFTEDAAFLPAWGMNAIFVGAGEAAVMYVLGLPLLLWLRKNKSLSTQLRSL